ncbi:MAG: hypothetical protein HQL36_10335 [Alphaproteobacteria bacterium]|nr:hypothetical protein [Alphaproteobacteria bacterium]MBF0251404.1 hypothetical protein [Alphaproteobacteria bacterium]
MPRNILERYAVDDRGRVLLDVAAPRVSELYQHFDKTAPFRKKDLDDELADYLIIGAEEIGDAPFVIRFILDEAPEAELRQRVTDSVKSFFAYLEERELSEMRRMARMSLLLFGAGIVFLALAALLSDWLSHTGPLLSSVFPEGVSVAGWVAMWHATATYLIEWMPRRRAMRVHQRLQSAPVTFAQPTAISTTDTDWITNEY